MKPIFVLNNFTIYKDEIKKTLFYIHTNDDNNSDYNSHLSQFNSMIKSNLINSGSIIINNNSEQDNTKKIFFLTLNCFSIIPFYQYKEEKKNNISYTDIERIIYCLSIQFQYLLENERKCFYTLDPNNILVVDNSKFIYLSNDHLKEVKNNDIYIYKPIVKNNLYLSPEIKSIYQIPIITNYKSIFYSLGSFIISILKNENLTNNSRFELLEKISYLEGNKIYYFLQRCLNEKPERRFLLYI